MKTVYIRSHNKPVANTPGDIATYQIKKDTWVTKRHYINCIPGKHTIPDVVVQAHLADHTDVMKWAAKKGYVQPGDEEL